MDHERGQIDTTAAEVYDELFVPALFGRFTDEVVETAAVGRSETVLDIACGTGVLTRELRARTSGRIVGVDLNPAMLAVAARHGGAIEYREGDAAALPFHDGEFDLATCQFGMMFFPQPASAVAEMDRVTRRGVVAVWDSIERSEGYAALRDLFERELGPEAAGSLDPPFDLGADGVLEDIFESAGLSPVSIRSVAGTARFESIDQWVTTEVRGWTLGSTIPEQILDHLISASRRDLSRFESSEGVEFGITARIASWGEPVSA